jgi:hypothetical protein
MRDYRSKRERKLWEKRLPPVSGLGSRDVAKNFAGLARRKSGCEKRPQSSYQSRQAICTLAGMPLPRYRFSTAARGHSRLKGSNRSVESGSELTIDTGKEI